MSIIKNKKEIAAMKETGRRLAEVFSLFSFAWCIGKTTKEIDSAIAKMLENAALTSTAYGYKGFSGYACLSLNDELVHGVPSVYTTVREGDLLKIDIPASHKGFCADMARMYCFESLHPLYPSIMRCGKESIEKGIAAARCGNTIGAIGEAISAVITSYNFSVVIDFCGHGIGRKMHEHPEVPNVGNSGEGMELYSGMALAIEPMFFGGNSEALYLKEDGWTAVSEQHFIAGHWEDTVIIDGDWPIVTTRREGEVI